MGTIYLVPEIKKGWHNYSLMALRNNLASIGSVNKPNMENTNKRLKLSVAKPLRLKSLLFLGIMLGAMAVNAQKGAEPFSLKQAVDFALKKNASVSNANLDVDAARAKVGETRAIGLPQITGSVNYLHNLQIQRTILENTPGSPFSSPYLAAGDPIFFALQLKNSAIASVGINQLIFNGSYLVGLQAAATYKELSVKQLKAGKITTATNVTKAYYGVLVNEERLRLLDLNINRLDSTFRETSIMFKNGFVEKIDLDRLEVSLNNLKTDRQNTQRYLDVTLALLKFQMGMDQKTAIVLTDKLENIKLDVKPYSNGNFDYGQRIEYSQLQTARMLNQLDLKNIRAGYLPSLGANLTLGANTSATNNADLNDRWKSYSYVGINLSLPIFDGGTKNYKAQQSRLSLQKTDNSIEQLKQSIDLQIYSANAGLISNLDKLNTQKRNYELAQEVVRVTKAKYQQGLGSNLEVTNAESSVKEAQTNYYAALYDVLISKVDLDVATGQLNAE